MHRVFAAGWRLFLALLAGLPLLQGCAGRVGQSLQPSAGCTEPNRGVREYFALVEKAPPEFGRLMKLFPKGGDIHNHLAGAVMPEEYLAMGEEDDDCYDPASYAITPPPCGPANPPLRGVGREETEKLLAAFSMYRFPYPDVQSGHDQFFAAFGRFKAVSGAEANRGKMLAMVLRRADADAISYVETMVSLQSKRVSGLADLLRQRYPDPSYYADSRNYPELFAFLAGAGLSDVASDAADAITTSLNQKNAELSCSAPSRDRACGVVCDFQATVNRNGDPAAVFTQAAFAFLLASTDVRVVGVNLVSGEDLPAAMAEFPIQMQFFSYFHLLFPQVNIALHAGELTPCFVGKGSPALKEHLTGSLEAGAGRIGHGVSFAYLGDADRSEVAALMRRKNALVEILLTSNAQILGVTGDSHPFPLYFRTFALPTAFATDDEGVSHADYTTEWLYAAMEYNLTWDELVKLARYSLQYSFLPGLPLWADVASAKAVPPCAGEMPGKEVPIGACRSFVEGSEKAKVQWRYEGELASFDRTYGEAIRKYLGHFGKP